MVGFFSKRKNERHGFNRYAEEINRYQSNSSVAGLPNRGVDRSASLTTSAGLAAQAALRIYEQKQQLSSSPLSPNGLSNGLPRNRQAATPGRTHSLTMHLTPLASQGLPNQGPNRANSLRTYVYNPLASYVAGPPTSGRRSQPVPPSIQLGRLSSLTSQSSRRANSLRSNSLTGLPYSRGLDSKPIGQIPEDAAISEEECFPDGTITSTKTTKILDSLGRVTLITVEIVRTLPDGLTVSETRTKNVSRPLLRLNSLTYRAGLMLSQSLYSMPQIDELRDFDGEYLSHDGRSAIPPAIPASSPSVRHPPAVVKSPVLLQQTFERSPVVQTVQALPESVRVDNKRTLSMDSTLKPLRLILKSSERLRPAVDLVDLVEPSTEPPVQLAGSVEPEEPVAKQVRNLDSAKSSNKPSIPGVAATAGAFSSPTTTIQSEDDEFKDAQDSFVNNSSTRGTSNTSHPYKQRARLEPSPQLVEQQAATFSGENEHELSKFQKVTNPDKHRNTERLSKSPSGGNRDYDFVSPSRSHGAATQSSGNSIKFLDKVETIPNKPVPSEEEEMWLAAFKAAEVNILGSRATTNQHTSPTQQNRQNFATSPSYHHNTKRSMLITSSLVEESTQNHKIAIPEQNLSHLNQHEIDFDGVKDDYEYQNHHKSFRGHSMRQVLATADVSLRKDRAKEEKKLAKLKGKEIKQREKEQALAGKEKKKKEKKSRLSSLFIKRKGNEEPTQVVGTPNQFNEIDEIDQTPISANDDVIGKKNAVTSTSPSYEDHIIAVPELVNLGSGSYRLNGAKGEIEHETEEISSPRTFDPKAGLGQFESFNASAFDKKPTAAEPVVEKSLVSEPKIETSDVFQTTDTKDTIPTARQQISDKIDTVRPDAITGTTGKIPLDVSVPVSGSSVPVVVPVTSKVLNSGEKFNNREANVPQQSSINPRIAPTGDDIGNATLTETTVPEHNGQTFKSPGLVKAAPEALSSIPSKEGAFEQKPEQKEGQEGEKGVVVEEDDEVDDRRYSHIEPNLKDPSNQSGLNRSYNEETQMQERLPDPTVVMLPTSNEKPQNNPSDASVLKTTATSDSDTPPMAYSTPLDEAELVFLLTKGDDLLRDSSGKSSGTLENKQTDALRTPMGVTESENSMTEVRAYTPELEQELANVVKEPLRHNSVADAESLSGSILEKIDKDYKQDDHNGAMLDEFTKKLRAAAETVVSPKSDMTSTGAANSINTGVGHGADVDTASIPTSSVYLSPQKSVRAKNPRKLLFGFKKKSSDQTAVPSNRSESMDTASKKFKSKEIDGGVSKSSIISGFNDGKHGVVNLKPESAELPFHQRTESGLGENATDSEWANRNGGINGGLNGSGTSEVPSSNDGNIVEVDPQTSKNDGYNKSKKKSKFKEKFYKYFINTYD